MDTLVIVLLLMAALLVSFNVRPSRKEENKVVYLDLDESLV